MLLHQCGAGDFVMTGKKTDAQVILRALDASPLTQIIEIDQMRRLRQPQIEHGHHALPTRQQLGLVAMSLQEAQSLLKGSRAVIREGGGFHRWK